MSEDIQQTLAEDAAAAHHAGPVGDTATDTGDLPNATGEETAAADALPRPTETFVWRYSARDLIDEMIWGLLFLAATIATLCIPSGEAESFGHICVFVLQWAVGGFTVLYWLWLAGVYFIRKKCTSYTLSPQYFEYQHGFFIQKTRRIELFDIEQVNLKRSLWERIIGVGTLDLRVKDQDEKKQGEVKPLPIPGIRDFREMQQKISEYRTYYRTRIASTVVRG